jgi:hypothetical protein
MKIDRQLEDVQILIDELQQNLPDGDDYSLAYDELEEANRRLQAARDLISREETEWENDTK